jgi:hypothetical protein
MQLSNPVAALISVPLQLNYDQDIGPVDDGDRWLLNVQPVIPFDLSDEWNLISRTILPVVRQSDIFPDAGTQTGTGDVVQSLFFSPKAPTSMRRSCSRSSPKRRRPSGRSRSTRSRRTTGRPNSGRCRSMPMPRS